MFDEERNYVVRSDELNEIINNIRLGDLGLISLAKRPILDSPHIDDIFLKILISQALKENVSTSVQGLVIRTLEPYLDLKKGLGTKRFVLPEKWDDPIPDIPENEPERFLGEDLESNEWRQEYWTYDDEQEFQGELSVYTTNHFIDNKDFDFKKDKFGSDKIKLKDAPLKCYMITGIQIMSDYKPIVDFIKIWKKQMKIIDIVSTETIWAQPNKFYEFRTPIVFNPDMDIVFCFTPNMKWDDFATLSDRIHIHGWICEPIGKEIMG
jgi:hypothetical protein